MAQYDVHNIEPRLQAIDSRIQRIDFNHKRERHEVVAKDKTGEEYIAFTVPWGQLDARAERELYRLRPENYNAFDEVRQFEADLERRQEDKISDMARDLADNICDSFRFKPSRSID